MGARNWVGYMVWGLLAYGLTKAVLDVAAWLGFHIAWIVESILYGVMLFVAAWLILQMHDSEKSS